MVVVVVVVVVMVVVVVVMVMMVVVVVVVVVIMVVIVAVAVVAAHAFSANTQEPKEDHHRFKTSLVYTLRPGLYNKTLPQKQNLTLLQCYVWDVELWVSHTPSFLVLGIELRASASYPELYQVLSGCFLHLSLISRFCHAVNFMLTLILKRNGP